MKKWEEFASEQALKKTVNSLKKKGYEAVVVKNGAEALEKIKELIPKGASVMNGSSVTLEQIGYVPYLGSGKHPWNDLHTQILAENDKVKRSQLRKQAALSDFYLGSVHGLVETGEFVIGSNSGSQMPHVVYTSPNLIFVVSTKKIVPTLNGAMKRLKEYVYPLEDQHMKKLYSVGTNLSKIVIFNAENWSMSKRKIHFILVKENLGF